MRALKYDRPRHIIDMRLLRRMILSQIFEFDEAAAKAIASTIAIFDEREKRMETRNGTPKN